MKKLTEAQLILRMLNGEEFEIEDNVEIDEAVRTKYKNVVMKTRNDIAGLQVKLGDVQSMVDGGSKQENALMKAKEYLSSAIKELSKAV